MKVPLEYARGTLRLSVGPTTTEEEVDVASSIIVEEVKHELHQNDVNP
jgi:cysteine sulfinate desulfinase/cysteine desulfurase-like protein